LPIHTAAAAVTPRAAGGSCTGGGRSSSRRPPLPSDGTRCGLPRTPSGDQKLLTAVSWSRQLRVVVLVKLTYIL